MYQGKKILAVITARGGSKRLPNKNLLLLAGKPLIQWTIEAALKSDYIDTCIVSTDSEDIANISKKAGAQVPFLRPKELATDTASSYDAIAHAIDNTSNHDYIMLLQPTSPLRDKNDINNAVKSIDDTNKAIVSVCEAEHSPLWTNTLPMNLSMKGFISTTIKNKRSQDLNTFYRLNGAIYIAEVNYFKANQGFFGDDTKALIMANENSIDIDNQLDFEFAEFLLTKKRLS